MTNLGGWRFKSILKAVGACCALLALAVHVACAAPFQGLRVTFTQPDGTQVEVTGSGDEFYAVFETLDGYTVVFDPVNKAYCFAVAAADGTLASSDEVMRLAVPSKPGIPKHLRMSKAARAKQAARRFQIWEAGTQVEANWQARKAALRSNDASGKGTDPQLDPPGFTTTGSKVGLTLLIDFDDDPATIAQAEIFNFCNADSYSTYGNNGSVKKYYQDVSNGRLTYSNVVTVYIRIPNSLHPKSWYNDTSFECGTQGNKLIADAISIMQALPNYTTEILPTFSNLTVDSQNQVVACNVFYAGANSGVWSQGLWPHSWSLYNAGAQELSPGGKKVYKYQITNIGSSLTLGTFCHENGHMLCGFPDIYDYDSDSIGGAGKFCLMNSGSSGGNPSQVCAYLKRAAGWATTVEINSSTTAAASLTATPGASFNRFYRYQKPGISTEYFLLEARYKTGRDANLPASGIAIWHIDEMGDRDNQSMVPNTSHLNYEVTLVQADNRWDFEHDVNSGDITDLYSSQNPAPGYVNNFFDGSSPSAQWWDGSPSGASFHDFSAPAATMTFMVGYVDMAPEIITQPQSRTVLADHPASFSVGALGTAPLAYQWYFGNAPMPGATSAAYVVSNPTPADEGDYWVTVRNQIGSATSLTAHLVVLPAISLSEALDTTNLTWTVGLSSGWESETDTTHDNLDAAQSSSISDNQESWMQTVVTGPGTLRFWWKVSSEPTYDLLELSIDGSLQGAGISGEVAWVQETVSIPAGEHTVRWTYIKDASVSNGTDRGWVDQVSFTPSAPLTLAEAVDYTSLNWTSGGANAWWGQAGTTHDGVDAAQSGLIADSQESWIQTVISVGPGTLTFWWSVSSESTYDVLDFLIDDSLQSEISGSTSWQQKSFRLASGPHTLKWRYSKDVSLSKGSDCGWLDQVRFSPDVVTPPVIGAVQAVGGKLQFDVTGSDGMPYIVIGSTNLLDWAAISTNNAPFTFTNTLPDVPVQFFRARSAQ